MKKEKASAKRINQETSAKSKREIGKSPKRTEVINFLLSFLDRDTQYLEIGVRNPEDNFNHIEASVKYSVDPGFDFDANPVDFKVTSDVFFEKLGSSEILSSSQRFDVIFIDGLHLAEQADRDIYNSLKYLKDDGFIVLHDCNPPSEWHCRENYRFFNTPAGVYWNGTTWKAFLKWRSNSDLQSCCIDSDWGVGVLSRKHALGESIKASNPFFEFDKFDQNRKEYLNLVDFAEFQRLLSS